MEFQNKRIGLSSGIWSLWSHIWDLVPLVSHQGFSPFGLLTSGLWSHIRDLIPLVSHQGFGYHQNDSALRWAVMRAVLMFH